MALRPLKRSNDIAEEQSTELVAVEQFEELKQDVLSAYENGVTIDEAEKKAAKFLHAQIMISRMIQTADLNARMTKNGYKTLRAQVYIDTVNASEKKPTEAALDASISTNKDVIAAQNLYEKSEVEAEALHRLYEIFRDGHIFMRGIAKGNFSG